ncbi:PucR family transcriptional regulator [Streptomyces sp. NPDC020141]|uniref:PucR family transcriptional regulator n=1 Tax=Streptomyces sp. NPDC020141 TaxID=3365065 RepID=UPI0037B38749
MANASGVGLTEVTLRGPYAFEPRPDSWPGSPSGADVESVLRHSAELLRPDLPAFTEGVVAQVRAVSPYYGDPAHSPPDLTRSALTAFTAFVAGLVTPDRSAESGDLAWAVGDRRGRDGVPLQALLDAYRVGTAGLWDALVARVVRESPERLPAMAYAAADLWRRADADVALAAEAHRRAVAGPPSDDGRHHRPALQALLRGHADPAHTSALAASLGLPRHGRYAIVLLRGPGVRPPDTRPGHEIRNGVELYWCPQDDGTAIVALLGDRPPTALSALIPVGAHTRGGVSAVVSGPAELGRARRLAELALGACRADGELNHLGDRLSRALALARPELAGDFADQVLGPVLRLRPADRTDLLTTLAAWLDRDGSTRRAGERLYCHRNTVRNRLRRLETLTGRRLAHPRDVVDLALALEAWRVSAPPDAGSGAVS